MLREAEEFRQAIQGGSLLMIVGTLSIDRDAAKKIVSENYPEVVYGGEAGEVSTFRPIDNQRTKRMYSR